MKKILISNIVIILISGCCAFTSQDCGCNPPSPGLSKEARDWIVPFDNEGFLTFEDGNGNTDLLKIERIEDTEFIGGDECGADSEVERAILQSNLNANLKFTVEATRKNYVEFNYLDEINKFIQANLYLENDKLDVSGVNISSVIDDSFIWNGEVISVLTISCSNSSNCSDYEMSKFSISKEFGLLEYKDKSGADWKRVD